MVKNVWRPDEDTMPVIFPRALPTDPDSHWDFTRYVPDVVIVMIGGNDFAVGQPTDEAGPATLSEFTDAYEAFVVMLREKYPAAHLFLATSPSTTDKEPPGHHSRSNIRAGIDEVVARRSHAHDARVYAVTPAPAKPEELTGCGGHGGPELHRRIASELAPIVRERAGW
jgi:hypothetical protein